MNGISVYRRSLRRGRRRVWTEPSAIRQWLTPPSTRKNRTLECVHVKMGKKSQLTLFVRFIHWGNVLPNQKVTWFAARCLLLFAKFCIFCQVIRKNLYLCSRYCRKFVWVNRLIWIRKSCSHRPIRRCRTTYPVILRRADWGRLPRVFTRRI